MIAGGQPDPTDQTIDPLDRGGTPIDVGAPTRIPGVVDDEEAGRVQPHVEDQFVRTARDPLDRLVAGRVGDVRLIDNAPLGADEPGP